MKLLTPREKMNAKRKRNQRNEIAKAKVEFVNTMRKQYKGFTEKKWALNSYRVSHPQSTII